MKNDIKKEKKAINAPKKTKNNSENISHEIINSVPNSPDGMICFQ